MNLLGTDALVSKSHPRDGDSVVLEPFLQASLTPYVPFLLSFWLLVRFRKVHSRRQVANIAFELGNQAEKLYFT